MALELRISGLSYQYGPITALDTVSVSVSAGSMLAIVGESGSGKTTLLRAINRTIEPAAGHVFVDGTDVRQSDPVALRRRIGYIPQTGGLLPHWPILRNVALVPTLGRNPNALVAAREAMALCGLAPDLFGHRFPHELSGGQRQRAALARALAAKQGLVLLDESFGALDSISRSQVLDAFAETRSVLGFTAVLVTHDIGVAARLSDAIAVMRQGRIEQVGTLHELMTQPETVYVEALVSQAQRAARILAYA